MTEQNHPVGVSKPTSNDVLKKILQQFNRFKGGPILILVAGVIVAVLWSAWFTGDLNVIDVRWIVQYRI